MQAPLRTHTLYHGSPDTNITVLEPREESPGHKLPGKYLFATQHPELAAMFLAPKLAPMQMSKFHNNFVLIAQCTEQVYKTADKGGAIYELPAESFQQGPSDMPEVEWYSAEPVRPLSKQLFVSSLEAMQGCGVKVYFVDVETYAAIQAAPDHGWATLQSLTPTI